MSKLTDRLKHVVFEEEPPVQEQKVQEQSRQIQTAVSIPSCSVAAAPDDSRIYEALVAKTNPDTIADLAKINSLTKPLEGIIPDKSLRLKAALAQSGISAQAVAVGIDNLINALHDEQTKFTTSCEKFKQESIHNKEEEASNLEKKIVDLQTDLRNTRVEIENDKAKLSQRQTAFAQAQARRQAELVQLKTEFVSS